ncbi:polyprenol monophosphomannose synthase [Pseudonocardia sp. TRM90224]|uniref:polyprenol monophosphomannose synthase n=1 Tax=Pseudonocardia sp. TRM90224 TaxID=2812678 RepID=UPI001E4A2347|nr:polyprenol monophosphomannose synthase [Pseudonocardia sp. TRM90224]
MGEPAERAVLVVVPTYNERDNLEPLVSRLRKAVPEADVLVVDDSSPDGTGEIADKLAAADDQVSVLHRPGKSGLGTAYLAGFASALQGEYTLVVEMDADGSHASEDLPALLTAASTADLVLGSRYVPGGEVRNWPAHRLVFSRLANLYARTALGVPIADVTAGFRVFRRQVLAELPLDAVSSQGYCFQIDMAWRVVRAGFVVREVPITFTERVRGRSKMSMTIVVEALWRVTRWGVARVARRDVLPGEAQPGAAGRPGGRSSGMAA